MDSLKVSSLNNQSTVLDIIMQMVNHLPYHIRQIVYVAKMKKGDLPW